MSKAARSLLALSLGCTLAAALFGFGTNAYAFRSAYEGSGREQLLFLAREVVYVILSVVLVIKGGWRGVLAAVFMAFGATTAEWLLFPAARAWAGTADPVGYAGRFSGFGRPPYAGWVAPDIVVVGIASALAQGLRLMAHVNPRGPRGEGPRSPHSHRSPGEKSRPWR